jgi:hypothetical protein
MLKVCSVYLFFESKRYKRVLFNFFLNFYTILASLSQEECQRVSTEGQNMRMELSEKFDIAIKVDSSKYII